MVERKKYICVTPCFHGKVRYRKGREAWFTNNYPKDKNGKLIHFVPVDDNMPPADIPPDGPIIVNRQKRPER